MRLSRRLPLFFFLVIAVGAASTFILVRSATRNAFRTFVYSGDAAKAEAYAEVLADYWVENGGWEGLQSFLEDIPLLVLGTFDQRLHGTATSAGSYSALMARALLSDRIVVADEAGVVVADTASSYLGTLHPRSHLAHGVSVVSGGEKRGTVLVGSMVDSSLTGQAEAFLASIGVSILWATALSAALALVLGLLLSSRISGPLAALDAAVRRVASGELSAEVRVPGSDELSALASSFNAMTAALARAEEAKKRLIADAAHELRTPVTLIRGTVEAMMDGVFPADASTLGSVHEETLRLSRLIDTLRELELIDSGLLRLELEAVDLGETARRAAALFSATAAEKGIALSVAVSDPPPPPARGDYLRLEEVVYNLLSNAIAYAPVGGSVRVSVEAAAGALPVRLLVEDSGPGIPADERERVFERFYRLDKARSSARGGRGLGLSIASEIVRSHGGSIRAGDSVLGGAAFSVELPGAERADSGRGRIFS